MNYCCSASKSLPAGHSPSCCTWTTHWGPYAPKLFLAWLGLVMAARTHCSSSASPSQEQCSITGGTEAPWALHSHHLATNAWLRTQTPVFCRAFQIINSFLQLMQEKGALTPQVRPVCMLLSPQPGSLGPSFLVNRASHCQDTQTTTTQHEEWSSQSGTASTANLCQIQEFWMLP